MFGLRVVVGSCRIVDFGFVEREVLLARLLDRLWCIVVVLKIVCTEM